MRADSKPFEAGDDGGKAAVMVDAGELMVVSGQQLSIGASRGAGVVWW